MVIRAGHVAGMDVLWDGVVDGATRLTIHLRWTIGDRIEPAWSVEFGYVVEVAGDPNLRIKLDLWPDGDLSNLSVDDMRKIGTRITATPAVSAVPAASAAAPGIRTYGPPAGHHPDALTTDDRRGAHMGAGTKRQMSLVGFMQAGNATVYAGSWRHPATEHGFLDASYYQKLGRTLEEGCFDLMFFDDRLAMPGVYGGSVAEAVLRGARPVKLDLDVVLGVIAAATRSIGLGATYSTASSRRSTSLDLATSTTSPAGGRPGTWSRRSTTARRRTSASTRSSATTALDRADEFLEATTGLWDTWEDRAGAGSEQALRRPRQGPRAQLRGRLVPRPRSAHRPPHAPGASGAAPGRLVGPGLQFAARWAELIFTSNPGLKVARSHYADQRQKIAEAGRDPDHVKILPMAYTVIGESEDHAHEREQYFLNDLVHPMSSLTLLAELMNYDFAGIDPNAPITDELIESSSGVRGLVKNLRANFGGETMTLADLAGHRATLLQGPRFVGTATSVADQMEEWFDTAACDGFVLAATHTPGAYEDVVRLVVPELQQDGVFRSRYTGATLPRPPGPGPAGDVDAA